MGVHWVRASILWVACLACASAAAAEREIDRLLKELLTQPTPEVPAGFTAKVLVRPGDIFYDPLYMLPMENEVWVMDDGGQKGERGGQIVVLDREGKLTRVPVRVGDMLPPTGIDVAPSDFGSYGGQVFMVAQDGVDYPGVAADSHISRIDPKTGQITRVCGLPRVENKQPSNFPSQGIFGPKGSPFAGKFFAAIAGNATVYQLTPDGKCTPFVTFSDHSPGFINFTPDGLAMLTSGFKGRVDANSGAIRRSEGGEVRRVAPDGTIDPQPLLQMPDLVGPLAIAPKGFGPYGGQWFFCVRRGWDRRPRPRPLSQALPGDEVVYRVAPGGKPEVFARGFRNPIVLQFLDDSTLWVADEGHQFYQRELPDGAITEIKAR